MSECTINIDFFGGVGDGITDNHAAFTAALLSNQTIIVDCGVYLIESNLKIIGKKNLQVKGNGEIKLAQGKKIEFEDCGDLTFSVRVSGNQLTKATIESFMIPGPSAPNTVQLTLINIGPDQDYNKFSVGNEIQTFKIIDGVRLRAYRGKIASITGSVITCKDDTTLGGSPASIANDQEIIAITSSNDKYCFLTFKRCDGLSLEGKYNVGLGVENCKNIFIGKIFLLNAGISCYYCLNGSIDTIEAVESPFYGFGLFKSRGMRIGAVIVDKALVGGIVCKNNWDTTYTSVLCRRSAVYGAQFKDDDGTLPSVANPDLQDDLSLCRNNTVSNYLALDCNLGLWLDGQSKDLYIATAKIIRTKLGASVLFESTEITSNPSNVQFGNLTIKDHFFYTDTILPPTSHATSPLRLASGEALHIDRLIMDNCLHENSLIDTLGSPFKGLSVLSADIRNCKGQIIIDATEDIVFTNMNIYNPISNPGSFITITASKNVLIDNLHAFTSEVLPVSRAITIMGECHDIRIHRSRFEGKIVQAAVFIDQNSSGSNIQVVDNDIYSTGTYGVTIRGAAARIKVTENNVSGSTTAGIHITALTAVDYLIEGKAFGVVGSFAAASLPPGSEEFIDLAVVGVGSSGTYNIEIYVQGSRQGLFYSAEVTTTSTIRVYRKNITSSTVNATSKNVKLKIGRMY